MSVLSLFTLYELESSQFTPVLHGLVSSLTQPHTGATSNERKWGTESVCVLGIKGTHRHTSASLPHVSHKAPGAAIQTEQQLEQKRSQPKVFGD